ncbi:hypothetical protein AVEN_116725-1 [Araneus ventricosus]|uniref:Uncharacterized protein n=1 Tax=Araneus ventricosus TaxID=182803 RepID=A0A4Y2U4B8_ARAVE|nr:hypothetical protein AVEN_116725-1 [Araneus ventricosus]
MLYLSTLQLSGINSKGNFSKYVTFQFRDGFNLPKRKLLSMAFRMPLNLHAHVFPSCLHLPAVGSRSSPIGPQVILDLIHWNRWLYVPTKENPADISSRGVSPKDLPDCRQWWEALLGYHQADWPKQPLLKDSDQHVLKERKKTTFVFSVFLKNDIIDALIEKYSSYTELFDVLAFCMRFINNCKVGKANEHSTGKTGPLTSNEGILSGNLIVSYVQNVFFNEEISCIKANKPLPKNNPLSALRHSLVRTGCSGWEDGSKMRSCSIMQNIQVYYQISISLVI